MSEKTSEKKQGYAALGEKIEIMAKSMGALAKDGTNKFSNYDYLSNESLVTAIRERLPEHKLSIISSVVDYVERDYEGVDNSGKPRVTIRSIVTMNFKVIDTETDFYTDEQFVGAEQDTGGKSMQQAITQCSKYFYFKLFKVTSKDEVDGDGKTTQVDKPKKQTSTAKATSGAGTKATDVDENGDEKPWLNEGKGNWEAIVQWVFTGHDINKVRDKYKVSKTTYSALEAAVAKLSKQD